MLTWGPNDWSWWLGDKPGGWPTGAAPCELLYRILDQVPGRAAKTIAHLGAPDTSRLQFLAAHFSHVLCVVDSQCAGSTGEADLRELGIEPWLERQREVERLDGRLHVALLVGTAGGTSPGELDRSLSRLHRWLVEGGLFLSAVPAMPRGPAAQVMRLRSPEVDAPTSVPTVGTHEIELQYRLRRAGFRGVRIRRVSDSETSGNTQSETLICMAFRRANN